MILEVVYVSAFPSQKHEKLASQILCNIVLISSLLWPLYDHLFHFLLTLSSCSFFSLLPPPNRQGVYDRELASLRARWQASHAAATSAARERHERVPPLAAFVVASLQPPPSATDSGGSGAAASAAAAAASTSSKSGADGAPLPPSVRSNHSGIEAAAGTTGDSSSGADLVSPTSATPSDVGNRVRGRHRRGAGVSANGQAFSSPAASSTPSPRAAAVAATAAAAIAASAAGAGGSEAGGGDENSGSSESAPTTPRGGLAYRPRSSSMSESTMSDDNEDEVLLLGSGDEEDLGSENTPNGHHQLHPFPLHHHHHHPHPSSSSSQPPHLLEADHGFGNSFGNHHHHSNNNNNYAYHQYGSSGSNRKPPGLNRPFSGGVGGSSSSSFDGSTAMEMALGRGNSNSGSAADDRAFGGGMGRSTSVSSTLSGGGGSSGGAAATAGNLNWLVSLECPVYMFFILFFSLLTTPSRVYCFLSSSFFYFSHFPHSYLSNLRFFLLSSSFCLMSSSLGAGRGQVRAQVARRPFGAALATSRLPFARGPISWLTRVATIRERRNCRSTEEPKWQ